MSKNKPVLKVKYGISLIKKPTIFEFCTIFLNFCTFAKSTVDFEYYLRVVLQPFLQIQ